MFATRRKAAENDATMDRVSFNILLARPFDSSVVPEDILAYTPESPDYEATLKRALEVRPEMKVVDIATMQADRQITVAKSYY